MRIRIFAVITALFITTLFLPSAKAGAAAAVVVLMQQATARQRQQEESRRQAAFARQEAERREREAAFFRRQREETERLKQQSIRPSTNARLPGNYHLERNIWPDIAYYLSEKKKNRAGNAVLLARIVQWNPQPPSADDKKRPIFIPSGALTQWKNGRYGITGLTPAEIQTCRTTPNSHGPVDALQPDVNAQLTCYGIVASRCMGMRLPEWYAVSDLVRSERDLLKWAMTFVVARTACQTCPCQPPLPPGLIWAPPGVEAEILCLGAECKP